MSKKSLSAAKAAQAANIAAPSSKTDSSYEEIYLDDSMLAIIASIRVFQLKGWNRVLINFSNGRAPQWGFAEEQVVSGHYRPETCCFEKVIKDDVLKLTLKRGKLIAPTKGSF